MTHALVIVVFPHDWVWLRYTLSVTQRSLQPHTTYLLTYDVDETRALFPECTVVSLRRLPFTPDDVAAFLPNPHYTLTYLTQLARLYAADVLPLQGPLFFLDADAILLQPVPFDAVGTRHGLNPYVFSHLRTLHPTLHTTPAQSADVPYYQAEPHQLHALHVAVSEAHASVPFWRIYLSALVPMAHDQGASDKELLAAWQARDAPLTCVPLRQRRLITYADLTPLLGNPQGVQVATCPPASQSLLTCCQPSSWTRVQRWFESTPLASPIPPQALAGLSPGTVVQFGCRDLWSLAPWDGWTYVGVDVVHDVVQHAQHRFPSHTFLCLDVCQSPLPAGTLAVCTDFFPYLSYAHALTFLLRLLQHYPLVLLVEWIADEAVRENCDHASGTYGVLWWDLPPFNVWGATLHGRVPMDGGTVWVHRLPCTPATSL